MIRKSLSRQVSPIECRNDNMIALKVQVPAQRDIVFVCVYVPPADSPYYSGKAIKCNIELLEELLLDVHNSDPDATIVILGDLNARTGCWNLHSEDDPIDSDDDVCFCPEYVTARRSQDSYINPFGEILIELCKVYHIHVENGCNNGDSTGKFTFLSHQGDSVVDYCLVANNHTLIDLYVSVGDRIESSHMPLEIQIGFKRNTTTTILQNKVSKIVWDKSMEEEVISCMKSEEFQGSLNRALNFLSFSLDTSAYILTEALAQAASCMRRSFTASKPVEQNKAMWFDKECRTAKRDANRALKAYKNLLTLDDRERYLQYRNTYKKLIRERKKEYLTKLKNSLIENTDKPDKFWAIIRSLRRRAPAPDIDLSTWKSHFENLFSHDADIPEIANGIEGSNQREYIIQEEVLDEAISEREIVKAISKIKHSKAAGLDEIPGELFKIGETYLVPFLAKFFNAIYDTQKFPKNWSKSIIVPIYKSGSPLNPHNYRGISLLGILSKVFSSVLTKRLQTWVEEHGKLCEEQAGFRLNHSTVDHIFTLHAMITNAVHGRGRGKLYVAFIDFTKAFDTVLRPCLWKILAETGVSTKFINMLKSMYDSVQACVRWNSRLSSFFECPVGTKQGAKESPILFSLYINHVAKFVRLHGKHGVQLSSGRDEIFFLLFADDVALLATTPTGLQTQIDNLEYASKSVGLKVNINKSKVMVFRRGGFLSKGEKWFMGGNEIEIVNAYKYLGYTFTTKLSETVALGSVVTKAKQKALTLLKTTWTLRSCKPELFFKMFDAQVQPSLLYASELWGIKEQTKIESAHMFACKKFLNVDVKTPNSLIYGELGRFPLVINSTIRAVKYWLKILKMPDNRLPKQALLMLSKTTIPDNLNWLKYIEDCLCKYGFAYIWYNRGTANEHSFLRNLKVRLQDCYRQEWCHRIHISERFAMYRAIKHDFQCEKYMSSLEITKFKVALVRFRFGRNDLRCNAYNIVDRHCPMCTDCIEDEPHLLLNCKLYKDLRKKYLVSYIDYMNSRGLSYTFLINGEGFIKTKKVAMFVYYAMKCRRNFLEKNHLST